MLTLNGKLSQWFGFGNKLGTDFVNELTGFIPSTELFYKYYGTDEESRWDKSWWVHLQNQFPACYRIQTHWDSFSNLSSISDSIKVWIFQNSSICLTKYALTEISNGSSILSGDGCEWHSTNFFCPETLWHSKVLPRSDYPFLKAN